MMFDLTPLLFQPAKQNGWLQPDKRISHTCKIVRDARIDRVTFSASLPPQPVKQQVFLNQDEPWQASVMNPGVYFHNGKIIMLYGANYTPDKNTTVFPASRPRSPKPPGEAAYSNIGYAELTWPDFSLIHQDNKPITLPIVPKHIDGLPDPRITPVSQPDGSTLYLITYNAVNTAAIDKAKSAKKTGKLEGAYIHLTTTKDFKTYTQPVQIGPDYYEKNGVFFPKVFNENGIDYLYLLHRDFPNIQIAKIPVDEANVADSLTQLADQDFLMSTIYTPERIQQSTLMKPVYEWEGRVNDSAGQIAAGPPPIQVTLSNGNPAWLLIYNGANQNSQNSVDLGRQVGAVLLDHNNPFKVLARSPKPILKATEPFELGEVNVSKETNGTVSNTTFATGAIYKDGTLAIVYGARDETIGVARYPMKKVIEYLEANPV